MWRYLLVYLLMLTASMLTHAYSLPEDVGVGPLQNCTIAAASVDTVFCNSDLVLINNSFLELTTNLRLIINGSLYIGNNVKLNAAGVYSFDIEVSGSVLPLQNNNNPIVIANIVAAGDINFGNNSDISGNLVAGDDINLGNNSEVNGTCTAAGGNYLKFCGAPPQPTLHHFRISHSGTGLTCAAEPVQVVACVNNDCSERFTGEVSLTMSPATGWVGGPDYTQNGPVFNGSGGQFDLLLSSNTAGSRTLAITSSVPTAQNITRCISPGGSCQLTFNDIGIQLDGDSVDEVKSAIPTQLTGKPSNVGYNSKQQRIRVVKANDTTGACETAVRDKTLDVQFSYTVTGAAGLADNSITITSEDEQQALVSANAARTVPLQFDAQGNGYFTITSQDAGSYSLRAAMDVPIINPDETELTTTLARSDSSLPFTVRPLALYAAAEGNNGAVAATGPAFRAAGDGFNLSVQAASWQPGLDENSDGKWDQCSLPDLGLPTISPRLPAWQLTQHQPSLRLPAIADGGVAGTLEYDDDLSFSAGNSISNTARVNYSEVGIVQFASSASFQGQPIQVCSGYIGRFYPASISVERREAFTQMYTPACGNFSYLGQPFAVDVRFSALNAAGDITQNYSADFATAQFKFVAETQEKPIEHRLMFLNEPVPDEYPLAWVAGISTLTDTKAIFIRSGKPEDDLPFMKTGTSDNRIALGAEIVRERDGVKIATPNLSFNADAKLLENTDIDPLSSNADFRFGRLVLENASGPEEEPLPLVFRSEYWSGSAFVPNLDDNCTQISPAALSNLPGNPSELEFGGTAQTMLNGKIAAGPIWILPSGVSNNWRVGYQTAAESLPIPLRINWLQYNWSEKTTGCSDNPDDPDNPNCYDENPQADIMFGRFRGNPRQIFWRERFQ